MKNLLIGLISVLTLGSAICIEPVAAQENLKVAPLGSGVEIINKGYSDGM